MSLLIPGATLLDRNLPCALCGSEDGRKLSHLVPSFVFKHAAVRSPTGFMRTTLVPNRRTQDGPKDYILCEKCETLFSGWEASFSRIFKGNHANPGNCITYTKSDAMCALSMVWRILYSARSHPELIHLGFGEDYSRTDKCFEAWSLAILNGHHPGHFPLYWIFFDHIVSGTGLPENINRYIFHATDFDLMSNETESFVYVHLPGIMIFGTCETHQRSEWQGLRVGFNGGRYFPDDKVVPGFVGELIRTKAAAALSASRSLSPTQSAKVAESMRQNADKILTSPIGRAMLHDFGFPNKDRSG